MTSRRAAAEALDRLAAEQPSFHGWGDEAVNWQLGERLLRWLAGELRIGGRTLETGCGYSTVLFAVLSAEHTVVSPVEREHERVRAWCADHDVATDHVRFVAAPSERWLPANVDRLGPLDAVLVDGDHAYPVPALDWFHAAGAMRRGGLMAIDDTNIRACGEVAAFLRADAERWTHLATADDAMVFRALTDSPIVRESWRAQPWNHRRTSVDDALRTTRAWASQRLARLRSGLGGVW